MKDFEDYIIFIKSKNLKNGIECLQKIYNYGYSVIDILDYFIDEELNLFIYFFAWDSTGGRVSSVIAFPTSMAFTSFSA